VTAVTVDCARVTTARGKLAWNLASTRLLSIPYIYMINMIYIKDKIKIIKSLPLALLVSREERCEVLGCFHVVVKIYRYCLEERVFIVKTYWITGSIKNCQRRFVEQFGGRNPPSKRCIQLLVAGCVAVSFRVIFILS
jgi:hypothetical protein